MAPQRAVPPKEVSSLKRALNELVDEMRYKKLIKNPSDLAKSLGLQRNTISGYMAAGGPAPSVPFIEAIQRKFGVDLRTFRQGKERLIAKKTSSLSSETFEEIQNLKAVVYILRLKMIDVLAANSKMPASEITRALDKEIVEQLAVFADQ